MVCFINWGRFQLLFDEPCLMCTYLESRFNIVKRVGNTENTSNMCFLSIHKMHIPVPNRRDMHFALVTSEAVAVGTAVQIVVCLRRLNDALSWAEKAARLGCPRV